MGLVIILVLVAWFLRSWRIVGPDEMAVLAIFGTPKEVCNSGPKFVPFLPGCYLRRYPTKLYNLSFPETEVTSSEGTYESEGISTRYGAQKLSARVAVYFTFPRNDNLIEVCKKQIPTKEEELIRFFEKTVLGSLRAVLGKKTWKEINATKEDVTGVISEIIKGAPVFEQSCIPSGNINFVIEGIKLPDGLAKRLEYVDEQRLEAEAAPFEAEQESEETMGAAIRNEAKATGKNVKQIQREIFKDPELRKEYRAFGHDLVRLRMGIDGKSVVEIRTPDAKGNVLGEILAIAGASKRMPTGNSEPEREKEVAQGRGAKKEKPLSKTRTEARKRTTEQIERLDNKKK